MKISKYLIIINVFFLSCKETSGQNIGNKHSDPSPKIEQLIPKDHKIISQEKLDIDGDSEQETVITTSDSSATTSYEYWFKNGKLLYQFSYPSGSINKKWLVNLDDDKQNEIIRAQGYEDGVDYAIYDIQNGKQIPLLYFNPALQDIQYPGKTFWGYPGDIKELITNADKKILVSLNNHFERDGDYIIPKDQHELPFIYFKGSTAQPDMTVNEIHSPQYKSLDEIRSLIGIQSSVSTSEQPVFSTNANFNNDHIKYRIEVLKNNSDKDAYDQKHFSLPVKIYKGDTLWKSNNHLVFDKRNSCISEGFETVAVKNNYFTIEHQDCSDYNILVSTYITFKVNGNEIYLHKYGESYFDKSNHDRSMPMKVWTEKNFGKIKFEDVTTAFLEKLQ
ncbi:hypothetical protein BBH99_12165 [Chryseobacterium contaminans]|uniref:Uncharacterized protein n=1 Tax=Chryseobacterium contaminans TaxID=1423959 RepID=A0A1M7F578_9FLAO|nr:hypothetical protein [Chryseobacterium contaminans]OCA76718.1 hypothetical protein BBH99_12165 [Chryseobacterium contaminans]SHL98849.1 hypothetical protein SAMN05444407_10871 [Chryseobacterium contaminans]